MLLDTDDRSEHRQEPRRVLLVAPHSPSSLAHALIDAGWEPVSAANAQRAHEVSQGQSFVAGLVQLPDADTDGGLLLELARTSGPDFQWIALLNRAHLGQPDIRRNVSWYCYDFCIMPVPTDRLLATLGHACGMAALRKSATAPSCPSTWADSIIGASPAIQSVRQSISTFALRDAPVLILGETGTGKELTASAIHNQSKRSAGPLVTVNCGALPSSLIQSELFGYERGAFTGADRRAIGKIEAANRGTIFLDEIGDLPQALQVNLLRFLQEHRIQRVGGHEEIELDLRVVAATNVDIERAVQEGRFREDLYYRLNVLFLKLPPLRERIEDIEVLAEHVFHTHAHERHRNLRGFSPGALAAMRAHSWPGNVRELINRVRRALIICESPCIDAEDLGLVRTNDIAAETLQEARSQAEREAIRRALLLTGGNVSEAARRLAITRATIYRMIRKYRLGAYAAEALMPDHTAPRHPGSGAADWLGWHPTVHQSR